MIVSNFFRKTILINLVPNYKINKRYTRTFDLKYSLLYTNTLKNVPPFLSTTRICYDQHRFYTNIDRKKLSYKLEQSKQLLTDNIELKRLQMRERKEILVQGIRDKKSKVQEKVREMEEIVERENILTIPNFLCVARSFLAPYIGYVIVQEHYQLAIGLLLFAGLTDLVSIYDINLRNIEIFPFFLFIFEVGWFYCTQLGFTGQ